MTSSLFFTVIANAAALPTLAVGSRGTSVSLVQQKLKALGYFNYWRITGYYGTITQDAVLKFQRAYGIGASGTVNDTTLARINQVLSAGFTNNYTVKSGDSFWIISRNFGTTVDKLKAVNNIIEDMIYPGQVLKVPAGGQGAAVQTALTESSNADLYWLSRIIEAEAGGEPYQGKVAVGNVIMNRVHSSNFPNTVKGVIFEYYGSIPQFSPVADGTIYNTPSGDSIRAAQEALNGSKPVGNSTYFFNPSKSSAPWIVSNKTYVTRIGSHVFYQ